MTSYQHIVQVGPAEPASAGAPSRSPVYRNKHAEKAWPAIEGVSTTWELFSAAVGKFQSKNLFGMRKLPAGQYEWVTYGEAFEQSKMFGSALRAVGVQAGGRCGVYGANSTQWMIALQGCTAQNVQCVPLYDTLGAEAIEFIINHAEVSVSVVQQDKLKGFVGALPKLTAFVKTVVSMGSIDDDTKATISALGITPYSWEEFVALGKSKPVEPSPPQADDISTIMYTSGTTGEPKGVLLKHSSIVAMIASLDFGLKQVGFTVNSDDVYLSYLPLAHIFDRVTEEFIINAGGSIGFWRGDVKLLVEDIGELRPTFFCGVPRIFDRIYSGVTSKVEEGGAIKKFVFNFAYNRKLHFISQGASAESASPFMDKLVFNKVKDRLGGRVRIILSGAAPLARHVEDFLKVAMCAPVCQGYGLTETCAGSFITYPNHASMAGTVGPPYPNIEICLESVPEMNYDAQGTPARGEICIRGPPLFAGYYKREDLTKEAVVDGWFHTGDIGELQPDGCMKIVDRKKNIFKLSQGEYVAVENIENVFGQSSLIDSVWVYGNSLESVLVGVVVPNEPTLMAWASGAGVAGDYKAVCATPQAKAYVLAELTATGKKGKLKGFEIVKAVHLDSVPFDMDRDLLTPTFKKKRPQLLKYYKDHIDAMYAELRKQEAAKAKASSS